MSFLYRDIWGYPSSRNGDKAETRTIFVPPNRSERQCVSTFTEMGILRRKLTGASGLTCQAAERQRRTIALGVCRTPSIAKQKLREHIETTGINSKQTFTSTTAPATTFRAQAEKWIASLSTRRRKPVKPATISGWQHALDKWILPNHRRQVARGGFQRRVAGAGGQNGSGWAFRQKQS